MGSRKNRGQAQALTVLVLTALLGHSSKYATAQNFGTRIPEAVHTAKGPVHLYVDLHDSLLYAGNQNALITLYVERLGLSDFSLDEASFAKKFVRGPLESIPFEDGRHRKKFECHFTIGEKSAPRNHIVKLRFQEPGGSSLPDFELRIPIGVREGGGLHGENMARVSDAQSHLLGQPFTVRVPLRNEFQEYPVRIHESTLHLADKTLWDSTAIEAPQRPIPALDKNSFVDLQFYPRTLSIARLLSHWTGETAVTLSLNYDDGHGRLLQDLKIPIPLRLEIDLPILLVFVVIGGAGGGILKITYEIWAKQKKLKDPQHVVYLVLSILLSCVVFFIMIVGEVRVEALEVKADPRIPIVALVIGLLSGLRGPSVLIRYLPRPEKKE